MDIFQLLTAVFTGLTAFGVLAAWWQSRPHLRAEWSDLGLHYETQEGCRRAELAKKRSWWGEGLYAKLQVAISNPSPRPDRVVNVVFDIRKPKRLRVSMHGDDESDLPIGIYVEPLSGEPLSEGYDEPDPSLPANDTRYFDIAVILNRLEERVGEQIDGVVRVKTFHATLSHHLRFTVSPAPPLARTSIESVPPPLPGFKAE